MRSGGRPAGYSPRECGEHAPLAAWAGRGPPPTVHDRHLVPAMPGWGPPGRCLGTGKGVVKRSPARPRSRVAMAFFPTGAHPDASALH